MDLICLDKNLLSPIWCRCVKIFSCRETVVWGGEEVYWDIILEIYNIPECINT